jgi:hypothetical protein
MSEEVGGAKENAESRQANRLSAMMVVLNGFAAEPATLLADYADWLDLQENSGARPDRIGWAGSCWRQTGVLASTTSCGANKEAG